jgi:hypothetical protein
VKNNKNPKKVVIIENKKREVKVGIQGDMAGLIVVVVVVVVVVVIVISSFNTFPISIVSCPWEIISSKQPMSFSLRVSLMQ